MRKWFLLMLSSLAILLLALFALGVAMQLFMTDIQVDYFPSDGRIWRALIVENATGTMDNGTLHQVSITLRTAPGSDPYNLSRTNITINGQTYRYPTEYGVMYDREGAKHQEGMLVRGDKAVVSVALRQSLMAESPLDVVIDSENSTKSGFLVKISSADNDGNITLYPRT